MAMVIAILTSTGMEKDTSRRGKVQSKKYQVKTPRPKGGKKRTCRNVWRLFAPFRAGVGKQDVQSSEYKAQSIS